VIARKGSCRPTGDSLSAGDVAINDRTIDTSSVEAIDSSVAAILDDRSAPRTVEDVEGVPADLSVDFTGPTSVVPDTFHGADKNATIMPPNLRWSRP